MKKVFLTAATSLVIFCLVVLLPGCLKDSCQNTYRIYMPVYKTLTQARAEMKSNAPQTLQNTGKIYVFGNYIFLNELNKGIHVIDNSNPSSPRNINFINIPNNVDLAVKGNYLYADSYSDIIVFDISNPANVTPVKFMNNVIKDRNAYWFGNRTNPDSIMVLVGHTEKDTTVDCAVYQGWVNCPSCSMLYSSGVGTPAFYTAAPQVGVGGSMARFTITNDYLYAVSNSDLYSINISTPDNPQQANTKKLGWNIETIYPFQNKLFIGSRTGMFIYDLSNPSNPVQQAQFSHFTSCDPVIADGQFAYVTLSSGNTCQGNINELDVIDISNLSSPVLKKTYSLTNPHGLSKDGNYLFICDGSDGLKIYNANNPVNIQLIKQIKELETYDVIAMNGRAIVVAKNGLYQYNYSNPDNITQISKISISK